MGMIQETRHQKLREAFENEFESCEHTHLVRAPGRVNLIGEHTDYNGLPVFPMAIEHDIVILFRVRNDPLVRLRNTSDRFSSREFHLEPTIPSYPQGDWGNYAKAAAQALVNRFELKGGFDAVVSGNIPMGAGLSSSSALVVACALILIRTNDISINRMNLMELLARGEHYVGTRGGGMDQAICLAGEENKALKIDFSPLQLTPTPIPENWSFLLAHSLVIADKSGKTIELYNARPVECRQALEQFCARIQLASNRCSYLKLMNEIPAASLLAEADETLQDPYRRRFRHVVSEGARVQAAQETMRSGNLEAFGKLMNQSHTSLRDDLEVSCEALDRLAETCLAAGACGARMTGAGFGGCVVALCEANRASSVKAGLERDFYSSSTIPEEIPEYLIDARPSRGANFIY